MEIVQFLMAGSNPASLAGILIVIGALGALLIRKELAINALVALLFGGTLCAINYIQIVRLGKDGFEISTKSAEALVEVVNTINKHKTDTAEAIKNLNDQIAQVGSTQKKIAGQLSQAANSPTGTVNTESLKNISDDVDTQNSKLIDLYNRNNDLTESIQGRNKNLSAEIETIKKTLNRSRGIVEG
jgi:predicted  nucleic acid-binding Zn-ribbon protein